MCYFEFDCHEVLKNLSDEEFEKHVAALATKRLEKPKRLAVQNAKFWSEIISQQYNFDRDNVEVAHLRELTRDDLYKFYKEMIAHDAPKRHKLSVHIISDAGEAGDSVDGPESSSEVSIDTPDGLTPAPVLPQPIVVTDEVDFKRNLPLYPLAKPFIDLSKARSKL